MSRPGHIGSDFYKVTAEDPGYLTDLRMKRVPDPTEYFILNARPLLPQVQLPGASDEGVVALTGRVGRRVSFEHLVGRYVAEDPDVLTQVLFSLVSYFGSWGDAERVAALVASQSTRLHRTEAHGRLVSMSANVFAISKQSPECRRLYDVALKHPSSPLDRFLTHMRLATAELKRLRAMQRATRAMLEARKVAARLAGEGLTQETAQFGLALIDNLEALQFVMRGDLQRAEDILRRAIHLADECLDSRICLPVRVTRRYRTTFLINMGLLSLSAERWDEAVARFGDALSYAKSHDRESKPECLALQALAWLRRESPDCAQPLLEEAERELRDGLSPPRLRQVRRLLAWAEHRQGRDGRARMWLDMAKPFVQPIPPEAELSFVLQS